VVSTQSTTLFVRGFFFFFFLERKASALGTLCNERFPLYTITKYKFTSRWLIDDEDSTNENN
jgi:hypothetical protein